MTWSYRGGEWFGVFGENAVVVLPPSEKARVAAVWELVDDGAGFDETLDALISSGLRDLPGFVLVSRDGDETRVVLRGEATDVADQLAGRTAGRADAGRLVLVEVDAVERVERLSIGGRRLRRYGGDGKHPCCDDAGQWAHGGMLSLW